MLGIEVNRKVMDNLKILTLVNKIDEKKWDEFILNHPKGNFFYSKNYYFSLKDSAYYDSIVCACIDLNNREIVGILVSAIQKDYKGILGLLTKRCIVLGEPIAKDNSLEIQIELINSLEEISKRKTVFTQFRFFTPISSELNELFKKKNYNYEPYLKYYS